MREGFTVLAHLARGFLRKAWRLLYTHMQISYNSTYASGSHYTPYLESGGGTIQRTVPQYSGEEVELRIYAP